MECTQIIAQYQMRTKNDIKRELGAFGSLTIFFAEVIDFFA